MPTRPSRFPMPHALIVASLIGGICILLFGMSLHAAISHDRTELAMHRLLVEKGGVLLNSLESGLRSGRSGNIMPRQGFMLEEMAARPDVFFIAITGPDGYILAHNNPARLGEVFNFEDRNMDAQDMAKLHPDDQPRWILTDMEGAPTFAMYKEVGTIRIPTSREDPANPGRPQAYMHSIDLILFVGLDPTPLFTAREEDSQRTILIAFGGIVCALLCIIALHWANKARRSRQDQLTAEATTERMLLSLPDGLILFDASGCISHINDIACLWLRYAAPPLGHTADILPQGLAVLAKHLLAEPSLPDTELDLVIDETLLPLSVRGGPVETQEEGRVGSIMILRDLSDRKHLEDELRRREKMVAIGTLAAGVAHEIRNPLSSIKGYATYFGARFPDDSEDREAARVMVGEVERLNRVISDLIELARPTSIMRRPTDFTALIEDIIRLLRQNAESRNVHIRLDTPEPRSQTSPDLPSIDADPDRLRQALLNLCLNALDAMPDGGELTLSLQAGDSHLIVEAHDTGIGIPPENLTTIFDPYFTTKGHGTGLGLATVHKIIEAHGGHIMAMSTPGNGSTFRIFLPLRTESGLLSQSVN